MSEHLRFAPDVLRRLGEELNPNPEQGMLELVRNAYDADAASCTVELVDVSAIGGKLIITDDGLGMTLEQLRHSWLVLGHSSKSQHDRTTKFDRLQVGSKGLGRLAALRLGPVARLRTRPAFKRGTEYTLVFDWSRFDDAETVDLVDLKLVTGKTTERHGTTIEVLDLRRKFTTAEVTRIARALLLLSSPFEAGGSFDASLIAPEYEELQRLVRKGYWDQAAYELHAGIDSDGRAWAKMIDHERDERVEEAAHEDLRRRVKDKPAYAAPEATFELSVFRVEEGDGSTRGRTKSVTLKALRDWLKMVGGVHLYHRGLRVHPYGDPGHDWLEMNLRRLRSPEERPSTNTSVGRVLVLDEDAVLQQKTDRTGFIETPAFEDLRAFAQDVLDWAARRRLAEAEARRLKERARARKSLVGAQTRMAYAIAAAPVETRKVLQRAERDVRRATTRELDAVAGDLELYRTLATIGTIAAVTAHEATNGPNTIVKMAQSVRRRARKLLGERYSELEEPVDLIEGSARRIQTLVEVPRRLMDRGKRRRGSQSLNVVVDDTVKLLEPLLEDHKVRVDRDLDASEPQYLGTVAALESVLTNLVINAVNALNASHGPDRLIRIQTVAEGETITLDVADNGPGISRTIELGEIWLPGRGTTERGVGLGLTIVRDIVADLDGRIKASAKGELGGAQFTIEIPREERDR
jgi:signal transduction histidine kinase